MLSSASSKTAYGTAFLLRGKAPRLVGLTSARHVAFTESLGCYDRVLPYEAADQLSPDVAAAYLDFAGRADVRSRIRDHLGARLVHDAVGHDALREVWLDVLAGRSAPRTGHVVTF